MREIIFRGKRKDDGEWEFGNLIISPYLKNCVMIERLQTKNGYHATLIVKPESVGQYTGIKDKNRKKIFEGDIVAFDGGHFVVEYIDCRMGFAFSGLRGRGIVIGFSMSDWEHIEIIGNIHDNPELLG